MTKERTLQEVLDEANPNELEEAVRYVKLGTTLFPLKRSFTGLASATAFDLTAIDATGETAGKANPNRLAALMIRSLRGGDAVKATLNLQGAGKSTNIDIIVAAKVAGTGGNAITITTVADAGAQAGTISEVGNAITIHYKDAVSTVADIRALLATSTLVDLVTNGTGATVLHAPGDTFGPTNLAGGQADTGCFAITDAGGTAIAATDTKLGIATISDDGKTITFPSALTSFTIEYVPRTLQSSAWLGAFAPAPTIGTLRDDSYAPQFTGTDPDVGFL